MYLQYSTNDTTFASCAAWDNYDKETDRGNYILSVYCVQLNNRFLKTIFVIKTVFEPEVNCN